MKSVKLLCWETGEYEDHDITPLCVVDGDPEQAISDWLRMSEQFNQKLAKAQGKEEIDKFFEEFFKDNSAYCSSSSSLSMMFIGWKPKREELTVIELPFVKI